MKTGVYQLIIIIKKETTLHIGKLGNITIPKGVYIYTGSAMNGLDNRIRRHLRKNKINHWHIDYLLKSKVANIIGVIKIQSENKIECELNRLTLPVMNILPQLMGFGSSDCRVCHSHLNKLTIPINDYIIFLKKNLNYEVKYTKLQF